MEKQPLPLSSPVWDGVDITSANAAVLQAHFRREIAPLIEATCTADPARYFEILESIRPHLFPGR
ncbi:hypothetical protein RSO01_89210 [Reyranella soli]|uniref:Uncharacterized protein n=1 Tax=Reyranella soli TaxID=1230389 RepID=A0A512NS35_9HYPH|nr:hypothetical protein RSO01_89210 [Reyranella soli]